MSRPLTDWRRCVLGVVLAIAPCTAIAQDGSSKDDTGRRTAETTVDAPTKKLLAAHGLFQHRPLQARRPEYADFLSEYPTHPQRTAAMYALAVCQYRQNDFDRAATLLSGVIKDAAFEQRPEALAGPRPLRAIPQAIRPHNRRPRRTARQIPQKHRPTPVLNRARPSTFQRSTRKPPPPARPSPAIIRRHSVPPPSTSRPSLSAPPASTPRPLPPPINSCRNPQSPLHAGRAPRRRPVAQSAEQA